MKQLFKLLRPYRMAFALSISALLISAMFASAMTAQISSLMNGVLTNTPATGPSRMDELFGHNHLLQSAGAFLDQLGLRQLFSLKTKEGLVDPISWSMLTFAIFFCQALFEYLGTYGMSKLGLLIVVSIRQKIIDRTLRHSLYFFNRYTTGDLLARVNVDVLRIQQAISVKMGDLFKETANAIIFLIFAFVLNWRLSLVLFVFVPLIGLPISVFSRKIRKYASHSQIYLGDMTSHLKEVFVGIRIVKGFAKEAFEATKLGQKNHNFLKNALREMRIVAVTAPVMSLVGITVILCFVCYGSFEIRKGHFTQGDFLVYVLVVYQLYQPIKSIARANSEVQQAVGVLPRIQELLDWPDDVPEPKDPQAWPAGELVREIRFRDVNFFYRNVNRENQERVQVLSNIDFSVKAGEIVAFVGPSGGGKSTLVNLLARFYDVSSGAIEINGIDVRKLSTPDLRKLFAIVTQDTVLFNDTIHNNIAYGMENCPREKVIEAARMANADGFIEALPNGYDSIIGESGNSLSGGQRQRLSIARAMLANAPILILDEATSALDTESEREVQQALENLMKSKTTFVIAHRLSTIRQAHKILVMKEGRLAEQGTHESLLLKKGLYCRLIQMQEEGPHVA